MKPNSMFLFQQNIKATLLGMRTLNLAITNFKFFLSSAKFYVLVPAKYKWGEGARGPFKIWAALPRSARKGKIFTAFKLE